MNDNIFPDTVILTGFVIPIPLVNPFCDVVTPVTNTSPITVSFDVGVVVPIPTLPLNSLLPYTYKR